MLKGLFPSESLTRDESMSNYITSEAVIVGMDTGRNDTLLCMHIHVVI